MISVIIPVYHALNTLQKSIYSVLRQSYSDLQVVVVIDGIGGEQDRIIDLCDSIQKKDNRVQIIIQENSGVDFARFAGLKVAEGEFVSFLDADDWLEPEALSSMLSVMSEDNYDYVEVSSFKCLGPIKHRRNLPLSGSISSPELFDDYFISFFGWNILPVSIWGKLYRMATIERAGISPSGFAMGEDLIFNMNLFPCLRNIYLLNRPYYNYRFGGMTSKYNPYLLNDIKSQFYLKLQAIEKYSYHKADNPVRIEMINVLHSDIKQRLVYRGKIKKECLIEDIQKEISEDFWAEVIKITNNFLDKSTFFIALMNRDAEALYDICKKEVDSAKIRRSLKRFASSLLSLL